MRRSERIREKLGKGARADLEETERKIETLERGKEELSKQLIKIIVQRAALEEQFRYIKKR